MADEPVAGEPGDFFQRAGFLEKVGRLGDEGHFLVARAFEL
jgi:hypothetical protein